MEQKHNHRGLRAPLNTDNDMEIIRSEKGKNKGRISVARTLVSMQRKEIWEASASEINYGYVRECTCKLARNMGREFSVSHTAEMGDKIVIIRTR